MDINEVLEKLGRERKLFHSEADFQFSLAWKIQQVYQKAVIRLEYCFEPEKENAKQYIDILVKYNGLVYPIELKYKVRKICVRDDDGECFKLKNQSAQDTGRYDFLKDIERLENYAPHISNYKTGYAIFLTNDWLYWDGGGNAGTKDEAFSLRDGVTKHGEMQWLNNPAKGTMAGRHKSIILDNDYKILWRDYSSIDGENSTVNYFKYTIVPVIKQHAF